MENLHEKQIQVLELYIQLEYAKFGKTKKEKYQEIHRTTKIATNTIISWIRRYVEEYREIREEIECKKYAKICDFKGLTEKKSKYIWFRLSGFGKEESKIKAGYSAKTKAANIERSPRVAMTMLEIRAMLITDIKMGPMQIIREHWNTVQEVNKKIEEIEYIDTVGPDGHSIEKAVRKTKPLAAKTQALNSIARMLGFTVADELKIMEALQGKTEDDVVVGEDELL